MGTDTTRTAVTGAITPCPRCGRRNRTPVAAAGHPRCGACKTDLPCLVDADDTNFEPAVQHGTLPVLVDIWAPWCGPCRTMAPVIDQLARDQAGRLKVVKVNADHAPRTAQRLQVRGIPTLILMSNGTERGRMVGAQPAHALQNWLTQQGAIAGTGGPK
ncbi:thioredoxin [Amycolatopsis thermoflava]|uniref:thioredoxin n=1 Tax=Amycolatopsis thermoflava TaxID=84480 RepID=UPI003822CF8C